MRYVNNDFTIYTVLPEKPKKIIEAKIPALAGTKSSWKPAANHPWRRFNINPEDKEKKYHLYLNKFIKIFRF